MSTFAGALGAFTPFVFTSMNSLATSTNRLAGAGSAVVDLGAVVGGFPLDVAISGVIKGPAIAPTTLTEIELWVYTVLDDVGTYPATSSGVLGTDAAIVFTNDQPKRGPLFQCPRPVFIDLNTAGVVYGIKPFSLAEVFGSQFLLAPKFGLFVAHNLGQNLAASGHSLGYRLVREATV